MAINESRLIITVDAEKLQESVSEAFRPLREAVEAMRAKLDELGKLAANWQVNLLGPVIHEPEPTTQDTSDGYHTFGELYAHRRALTAALATTTTAWRSKKHHPLDETIYDGYFVVGIEFPAVGTITYHYELEHWGDFRNLPTLEHAPRWDGATPDDTVARLLEWATA
jgi:hypothetical protein